MRNRRRIGVQVAEGLRPAPARSASTGRFTKGTASAATKPAAKKAPAKRSRKRKG